MRFKQGELEHRSIKKAYKSTSHVDPVPQTTALERREAHLCQHATELNALDKNILGNKPLSSEDTNADEPETDDPLQWGPSSERYSISLRGTPIHIGDFINQHISDPAVKVSIGFYIIWRFSACIWVTCTEFLLPAPRACSRATERKHSTRCCLTLETDGELSQRKAVMDTDCLS